MRAYEYKKWVLAVLKHKHTNVFLSGTHQILLHKLVPGIDANPPWLMMILMQCLFLDWNLQLSSLGLENLHFYVLHLHLLPFMLLTTAHLWNLMKKKICFDALYLRIHKSRCFVNLRIQGSVLRTSLTQLAGFDCCRYCLILDHLVLWSSSWTCCHSNRSVSLNLLGSRFISCKQD